MKFTNQIRRIIDECGLSRYEIGKRTGIDEATLSRFMSGKGGLSCPVLDKLAEALDLEIKIRGQIKRSKRNGKRNS